MKVSEELIDAEAARAYLPMDSNYIFLLEISNHSGQRKKANFQKLDQKINAIKQRINQLEMNDKEQWLSIILNKIRQLLNKYWNIQCIVEFRQTLAQPLGQLSTVLRESLYVLVYICVACESIQYQSEQIEKIIKDFYYKEYGQEIISYFQSANYNISNLVGKQYKNKKVPFLCCLKQQGQKQNHSEIPILD